MSDQIVNPMSTKPLLSFYTNIPTPYQQSFFRELARNFQLKVIYYSITESNREWRFNMEEEYEVVVLKNNAIAKFLQRWVLDFHFSWEIFRIAWQDKSRYVIVGGSYWIPNATIVLLISKWRSKTVAYFSEPLFEVSNRVKYVFKWAYLRILNLCCDAIFCIGKKAAESFDRYKVRKPKFIIPYNINTAAFSQLNAQRIEALRMKFKSANETVILSSGALINRKGMDILIKAVKLIDDPGIRLLIIGDGPERKQLEALAGEDARIEFAGFKTPEEVPYYFAIADIFAFASRYDGWAVVINEAIAANVPVISSDKVGAAVDLITSQKSGIICKSESVEEFREAIIALAGDAGRRGEIRRNAKDLLPLVSSDYNARKVLDIFVNQLN
jgi:glycosyltransferase involved in cell wall biosynthesis